MMYENTEFGWSPIACNSVWNMQDLMKTYAKEIVPAIMGQAWAVDEMMGGYPQEMLEDDIWKGYEIWAIETIEREKAEHYEGLDEEDFN